MATVTIRSVGTIEVGCQTVAQFEDAYDMQKVNVVLFPERRIVASFPLTKRGRSQAWDVAHDINAFVRSLTASAVVPQARPQMTEQIVSELWG